MPRSQDAVVKRSEVGSACEAAEVVVVLGKYLRGSKPINVVTNLEGDEAVHVPIPNELALKKGRGEGEKALLAEQLDAGNQPRGVRPNKHAGGKSCEWLARHEE